MKNQYSIRGSQTDWEGAQVVRDGWLRLERLRSRFENGLGRWTGEDNKEITSLAEALTDLQIRVDAWPRGEPRRRASREIQRVVRVSEELLVRPNFVDALGQRLRRDLDLDVELVPEIPWLTALRDSCLSPASLLIDMDQNAGVWKTLPWGVRTLVRLRMRDPSLNDWWFRKPK
jgi:hypothetical protein